MVSYITFIYAYEFKHMLAVCVLATLYIFTFYKFRMAHVPVPDVATKIIEKDN